jgi:hypothetical protein
MAVSRVQWEGMVWSRSAWRLAAQRVHLLHLIRTGWGHAPILLLLHAVGVVWPSAPSPFATLHRTSGDLHPLLQDVCGCVAVSEPIQALPHIALFWKRASPIDGYYFQHRTQGTTVYIAALTPGK